MKRIFDIIFIVITIFIVSFIILNTELILKSYDFNLFGFSLSAKIIFYLLIFFLIYILINWIFIRFIFVFGSSNENKLNKKIIKMQEEINQNKTELQANIINEIKEKFDKTINNYTENNKKYFDEKWEDIDSNLGKISAELAYLKKED